MVFEPPNRTDVAQLAVFAPPDGDLFPAVWD